jgi:spore maturation protein CgeB
MPEHREFFEVGKEIETWHTVRELVEKIRYYLNHEAERLAIAEAGRQRALTSQTWAHRFRSLFDALGLH